MHTLREARISDAAVLCSAEQALVRQFDGLLVSEPDELIEAAFAERIAAAADGRARVLVVEGAEGLVAHGSVFRMNLTKLAHVLRLDLCVHVGHWRQGHGERILRGLVAWAREQTTAHKIELLVRADNAAAGALYRKVGFVEEGRHKHRVRLRSGRYVDDLAMALMLRQW